MQKTDFGLNRKTSYLSKKKSSFSNFFVNFPISKQVTPKVHQIDIRTDRKVPKLGLMLVGWGGNNGSTLTAALEANRSKMEWRTKEGTQQANFYGSITQSSTVLIGSDENLKDIYLPMKDVVPMVDSDNIVVGGWDISSLNIGESMKRAKVLDVNLQDMLYEKMSKLKPRPSIYDPTFIAANQVSDGSQDSHQNF